MSPEPHPAKLELVRRRTTQRRVADTLGFSEHYVSQALNGHVKPSTRFRRQLSAFLGLAEAELFNDLGGAA